MDTTERNLGMLGPSRPAGCISGRRGWCCQLLVGADLGHGRRGAATPGRTGRYYRADAPDYDDNYLGKDWDHSIEELPITGDVLELACGTGHWTRLLTARARSVTAVDAGPGGDAGLGHGVPVAWPVGLPCLGTG